MATQTGSIDLTASNSVKLAAEAGWQSDLDSYYTKSEIDVTVGGINSTVSTKVGEDEVISSINQSSESVLINANKINLTGAVTISDLASDAQNATLNSNISVGGRNLLPTSLVNSNVQRGVTASGITIVLEDDGWFRVSGSKSGNSAIGLWSDSDYTTPAVPQLDNVLGKTLTWTIETEGTPFVAGSTYSTSTHIVAYGASSSNAHRFGGAFDLVQTVTPQVITHYGEIRYYIGANVPDGTTVDGRFRVMVEMGNVSTAWTPAPEDTPDQMTWYGTCSTAASTAEKAVACDGFELQTGARIAVKSTTANTANAPTLNVNGTGAIATWYNNAVSSSSNPIRWGANATLNFIYDGSVWVLDERPPSYSATCSTAAGTRAKAPSVVGALVVNGTRLSVRFSTANTYTDNSVQLNLASTGAYSVYQNNAVTSTTNTLLWDANTILTFVAQGTYWHLLSRSDASETATSYVTEITGQNGIMVHPSTDDDTGVRITSDVDIRQDNVSIANFGALDSSNNPTARVGKLDDYHLSLDQDSLDMYDGEHKIASYSASVSSVDDGGAHDIAVSETSIHVEPNPDYVAPSQDDPYAGTYDQPPSAGSLVVRGETRIAESSEYDDEYESYIGLLAHSRCVNSDSGNVISAGVSAMTWGVIDSTGARSTIDSRIDLSAKKLLLSRDDKTGSGISVTLDMYQVMQMLTNSSETLTRGSAVSSWSSGTIRKSGKVVTMTINGAKLASALSSGSTSGSITTIPTGYRPTDNLQRGVACIATTGNYANVWFVVSTTGNVAIANRSSLQIPTTAEISMQITYIID